MPVPGIVLLNGKAGDAPPDATIVISGPPRSGTSLVAAMAAAAGLWLGDAIDRATHEDADLVPAIEPHPQILRRAAIAARNWRRPRLALRGVDVGALAAKIAARNARFGKWGFKRPNIVPILRRDGLALLRKPRLIMTLRDPLAMAERATLAQALPLAQALAAAQRHLNAHAAALADLPIPIMLVSYEKARAEHAALFASVCDFCGLAPPAGGYAAVKAYVADAADAYRRFSSGTICGYIEAYRDGALIGWCRRPGDDRPAQVEIRLDDVVVARATADRFRRDIAAAYGEGRHGFRVPLPQAAARPDARLRAFIAGTDLELESGGRRVADLMRR